MKVKAKIGFIHEGEVHKSGEVFDALGYAFTWLTEQGFVEPVDAKPKDDLLLSKPPAELPPLDETPKKGKKND